MERRKNKKGEREWGSLRACSLHPQHTLTQTHISLTLWDHYNNLGRLYWKRTTAGQQFVFLRTTRESSLHSCLNIFIKVFVTHAGFED